MNDLEPVQRSDQQLAADLAAGDASATDEIALRYASDLYDFAVRTVLDEAAAAGIVESVLNGAQDSVAGRPPHLSLRAWLFGLTRETSLDTLEQRRGDATPDQMSSPLSADDAIFSRCRDDSLVEMGAWAWQAARSQRPADYSLLDLSLRRRLTPEEVAEVAGISRTGIYSVLGRLRGSFEESFSVTALFHLGPQACEDLASLAGQSETLRPALRRDIARHAESCALCHATTAELPLASDLFDLLSNVEPVLRADVGAASVVTSAAATTAILDEDRGTLEDEDRTGEYPELRAPRMPATESASVAAAPSLLDELYAEPAQAGDVGVALASASTGGPDSEQRSLHDELYGPSDDQEDDAESEAERAARPVPLNFTRGRPQGQPPRERIRFERRDLAGSSGGTGNRITEMFGGSGLWAIALLIGITLVAGYIGWAVGDSVQGGGNGNGLSALPTRPGGGRTLPCGSGPVTVDQGSSATLSLDARSLNGYQVSGVAVQPVSQTASAQAVMAKVQGANTVVMDALVAPGPAGRTDEYKLSITLSKGSERAVSDCTVLVRAPTTPGAGQPTAPTGGTPGPSGTAITPGAVATATPVRTAAPGSTATRVP